jgi:hypothetical protein
MSNLNNNDNNIYYKVAKIKNNNLIQVWRHINFDQAYAICSPPETKIPSPNNSWHLMLKMPVINYFSKLFRM